MINVFLYRCHEMTTTDINFCSVVPKKSLGIKRLLDHRLMLTFVHRERSRAIQKNLSNWMSEGV